MRPDIRVPAAGALLLAACSGGGVLTSYEAESDYVRSKLTGDPCQSKPRDLVCELGSGVRLMVSEGYVDAGETQYALAVTAGFSYGRNYDPSSVLGTPAARQAMDVMSRYGVDQTYISNCLTFNGSSESPSSRYAASCTPLNTSDGSMIVVTVAQELPPPG